MNHRAFEKLVDDGFRALPERVRKKIRNVVIVIEDEPSVDVRKEEGLRKGETLLGRYYGTPETERGVDYGVGPTLPDTITLYQKPIEEAAEGDARKIPEIVRDTIWHEFAHYFGMSEREVEERENGRDGEKDA